MKDPGWYLLGTDTCAAMHDNWMWQPLHSLLPGKGYVLSRSTQ